MTEIEIRDPDPEPEEGAEPDDPQLPEEPQAPYRNLLVPLIVVPALIVMVLVLVFVLFGAILGEEASPDQNVDRLLRGGANEREQAAFNLVRQFLEAREERADWTLDPALVDDLERELVPFEELEADDIEISLAITILLAEARSPEGVARLGQMTQLSADLDPEGQFRSYAAFVLGSIGAELDGPDEVTARRALVALLDDADPGLQTVGAIGLQNYPGPSTVEALSGLLGAHSLELRGNAALSLARLGEPAAVDVLLELVDPETYEAERREYPRKWSKAQRVSESRRKALEALASLDAVPPAERLEDLAENDPDGEMRALARRLLSGSEG